MKGLMKECVRMPTRKLFESQLNVPKPKEHGAWGMLFVPFVMGVGIAGSLNLATLWLLMAVTFAFVSQKPFAQILSTKGSFSGVKMMRHSLAWLFFYAGTSATIFAWLYFHYQLKGLRIFGLLGIPIVLVFNYFVGLKKVRTVSGEMTGIMGLTMSGPMAHYVATGAIQSVGFWLWILCIFYFASSIFYVKAVVQGFLGQRSNLPSGSTGMERACRLYHLGLLAMLLLLLVLKQLPPIGVLAYLPVVIRGLRVSSKPQTRLNFAIIGWSEVGYSIFFALLVIAGLREIHGLSIIPLPY